MNEELKFPRDLTEAQSTALCVLLDRAYYNGARQAAAMAHQSLKAMDDWIRGGCGGRIPSLKAAT